MKIKADSIVYIESDTHLHKVMNQIFKANGKELRCFDCPVSALNDPRTSKASLIILDADIPNLDLEKFKTRFKNITLAFVSKDRKWGLSKPIDRKEIEELISKVFSDKADVA